MRAGVPTPDQLTVGATVWAFARGWWREARVLTISAPRGTTAGRGVRSAVLVAYRLGRLTTSRLREQALPLSRIRLEEPPAGVFRVLRNAPAPERPRT